MTNKQQTVGDKKQAKLRQKKSKSEARYKSRSSEDSNSDNNNAEWCDSNADKLSKWNEAQDRTKEPYSTSTWDPEELGQRADNVGAWNEKDASNRKDLPSKTHAAEAPSGQHKLSSDEKASSAEKNVRKLSAAKSSKGLSSHSSSGGFSKKGGKGKRTRTERIPTSDKPPIGPSRTASDEDVEIDGNIEYKEKVENSNSNSQKIKRSTKNSARSHDRGRKEDVKSSRRASGRHEFDDNCNSIKSDKPPSKPKLRADSTDQNEEHNEIATEKDDMQPTKPKRRSERREPPENNDVCCDDEELGVGSFHGLRKDSDKPRSKSNNNRRRTPNSSRRKKTPSSGRSDRRRLKDRTMDQSDHPTVDENSAVLDDEWDDRVSHEVILNDEDNAALGSSRRRKDRRKSRERVLSNDNLRKTDSSTSRSGSRSSLPSRKTGIRRSHSERWMRAVEGADGEGAEDPKLIRRRAKESLNRANDGLSRSAHSKVRRYHSTGPGKMIGGISHRSYHGGESGVRAPLDGRRTPRRPIRHHEMFDSAESFGDDSIGSFDECGRSQGTLDSIDDFEDFGEDFYGMDLQTPGMVDFEEEVFDLMQRANPEVTEHLDRRVHRKREMVAYDQNMPLMTRQALLTRQASAQVRRQVLDGSNIDRNRLLLRNDSMSSTNSRDELALSSHRSIRSSHGRRAPPRSKSSGLGVMGQNGYMQSLAGSARPSDSDDRRRLFRSRSSHGAQTASFNQYSKNKPNKVRSLSRRASGDLIQPHTMRGSSWSSDHMARHRSLQRANLSTSLRRSSSSDHVAPRKPERKGSKMKNQSEHPSSDIYDDNDSELESDYESPSSSPKKPLRRKPNKNFLAKSSLHRENADVKIADKNDMSNKRNRSKLHALMYKTKMCVDMNVLFKHAREGEIPRSPIHALRMPSP